MAHPRTLALAALALLCAPALGAAAPYLPVVVSSAEAEQLVEGHTVFTVIEVNRTTETGGTTRFAAAVAVLVREHAQESRALRFPGVLWFNDQYLVNPQSREVRDFRYPCGGAVMAVNRGDPDPRVLLANAYVQTDQGTYSAPRSGPSQNYTVVNVTADTRGGSAYANASADGAWPEEDPGRRTNPVATPPVGTPQTGTLVPSQEVVPAQHVGASYKESYQITDPNDHVWVIDRYNGYYRQSFATDYAGTADRVYEFPVWVVNLLGASTFLPDDGATGCTPFYDLANILVQPVARATDQPDVEPQPVPWPGDPAPGRPPQVPTQTPGREWPDDARLSDARCDGPDGPAAWDGHGASPEHLGSYPAVKDDPCRKYQQPSRNGYCYGGQAVPASGSCTTSATPLRLYNALLYFKLEDLRYAGALRDHNATSTDTNGCAAGTEWSCPAEGDNAEGNSHPFHPTPHAAHKHDETPCYATGGGYQPNPNPTNHGGSRNAAYGADKSGAYPGAGCDYVHATRDIDLYFSPEGRPLAPPIRKFDRTDDQGSNAPFHDSNRAYGTSEP